MDWIIQQLESSIKERIRFLDSRVVLQTMQEQDKDDWITIEKLVGIAKDSFPLVENLDVCSAKKLNELIVQLWETYNIEVDLPMDKLNSLKLYPALLEKWKELVPKNRFHQWMLEFCLFSHPEDCILGTECGFCAAIEEEIPTKEIKS